MKNNNPPNARDTSKGRTPASGPTCPALAASNARTGYALMATGYQGIENHLSKIFQSTLNLRTVIFSPQQKVSDCKIKFFIYIPCFICVHFKHDWSFTNAMMLLNQVLASKDIKARILFINRRQ